MKKLSTAQALSARLSAKDATIGIIGLGYVGLPLVDAFCRNGWRVLGFDVDEAKTASIQAGRSYIKHIDSGVLKGHLDAGRLAATSDMDRLEEAHVIIICVPTPLTRHLEPDLSYVIATTELIAARLKKGQLIVLESTTYPGTTRDTMQPRLERSNLRAGVDFFLAYSPEREDPGNIQFSTSSIPKVVGADDENSLALAKQLYDTIVPHTVPVSTAGAAEAVKITENIFRAVNIALVNELKLVYSAMGLDVWEIIDAAKTKPFGFMAFYPGPGLGGHCIPIDPFYLTWKAREFNVATRFIELAGQVNSAMPDYVVARLGDELSRRFQKSINGSRILVLGAAYKKNVDDVRESPALVLMELLESRGAITAFYDPFVEQIPNTREHPSLNGRRSVEWAPGDFSGFDACLIATDHDAVDYVTLLEMCPLILDTRGVCRRRGISGAAVATA